MALRRLRRRWASLASSYTAFSISIFRFLPTPRCSMSCVPWQQWSLASGLPAAGIHIGRKLTLPPNRKSLAIGRLGRRTGEVHLVGCGVLFDSFEERVRNLLAIQFALQIIFVSRA